MWLSDGQLRRRCCTINDLATLLDLPDSWFPARQSSALALYGMLLLDQNSCLLVTRLLQATRQVSASLKACNLSKNPFDATVGGCLVDAAIVPIPGLPTMPPGTIM